MTGDRHCCDAELLRRDLTNGELELVTAGFNALWRGERRDPAELLPTRPDAERLARGLATRGRAELDDDGRVVGIHGLTLRPTRHSFTVEGRDHQTWCAFDAIGIPAALRVGAVAHTDCPACHRAIHIRIDQGVPEPSETVLWIPTTAEAHLMADFCASADLYCNLEHLEQIIDATRVSGDVTDLASAATLGGDTWADVGSLASLLRSTNAP